MNLKQELEAEQVSHLDLTDFCQAATSTAVSEVIKTMQTGNSSICLVMDGQTLTGVITERDVLRKIATDPQTYNQPIETIMTAQPVTILPTTSAADALWLMDDKHFRNLPVVDSNGKVVGNMTHQSVIHYLAARYPIEVQNRPHNPERFPRKAEGGD